MSACPSMGRGSGRLVWAVSGLLLSGCAGSALHATAAGQGSPSSHRSPRAIPDPWRPERALRQKLEVQSPKRLRIDARDGVSPDEAALLAVGNNPQLAALRARRGVARAELVAAGILPNPRINGLVGAPFGASEAQVVALGGGLSWNVTPLLARSARVASAHQRVVAVDLEVAWQEWQLAQAARLSAIRLIYLSRRIALAREIETTWKKRVAALGGLVASGAVTELELLTSKGALGRARLRRLALAEQRAAAHAALGLAIGVDATETVRPELSWRPKLAAVAIGPVLAKLPRRRLDLIALAHARRSHDAARRAAVLASVPAIAIGVQVARDADRVGNAAVTLSLELPIFDRNQGARARARARIAQVDAEYDKRLRQARAESVRIARQLAVARDKLETAEDRARTAARLATLSGAAARSGALSVVAAVAMQQRAFAAKLRALQIEQGLAELRLALSAATGLVSL